MKRAKKQNSGPRTSTKLYGSYIFKDKDPAIDELRTVIEQHFGHRVTNKDLGAIQKDGGPTVSCMRAWFFGDTKRPQNPTLEAAGRAMGYRRVWQRMRSNE